MDDVELAGMVVVSDPPGIDDVEPVGMVVVSAPPGIVDVEPAGMVVGVEVETPPVLVVVDAPPW